MRSRRLEVSLEAVENRAIDVVHRASYRRLARLHTGAVERTETFHSILE